MFHPPKVFVKDFKEIHHVIEFNFISQTAVV